LQSTVHLVVAEEILDGLPDRPGGGAGAHDDVEELGGDGAVDPRQNGVVITAPVRVGAVVGGRLVGEDVGSEPVATERHKEEFPPAGVVAVVEAESNWDVGFDGGCVGGGVGRVWDGGDGEAGIRVWWGGGAGVGIDSGGRKLLGESSFAGVEGFGAFIKFALLGSDLVGRHGDGVERGGRARGERERVGGG
jgi:hypothetical protein